MIHRRFITFEGPEGSGKTTHSKLLCEYLRKSGFKVIHMREPGGCRLSERIRKLLLDVDNKDMSKLCELFLYLACRAQLVEDVILPALKKGIFVVCDRFSDATLAYQGYGSGLALDMVKRLCSLANFKLQPCLTILLDISPKEGLKRAGRFKDRLERKPLIYHTRVREGYLRLARENYKRIKVFSSSGDVRKVQQDIRLIVEKIINGRGK